MGASTPRELVIKTLEFENKNERAPRHLWTLPWADQHHPDYMRKIQTDFPSDIANCPVTLAKPNFAKGDPFAVGQFIDDWGCIFENIHPGVIGEVKQSIVPEGDDGWDDDSGVHIPTEWLTFDREKVNDYCRHTDKFVLGGCWPRPFERLQFIRGTEQLYMDLMDKPEGLTKFIKKMHDFYCECLEAWSYTDVDALCFKDDWGSQISLLINPAIWVEIFKPIYKDYIDIAHRRGKKAFMHSDGNVLAIYPHLIELGLDAFNSQIFCMGFDKLSAFTGKITFWGEIDRQVLIPTGTTSDIHNAVREAHAALWRDGGCIAQCEFGPGAKPENIYQVFDSWNQVTMK